MNAPRSGSREAEILRVRAERLGAPAVAAEDEAEQFWMAEFPVGTKRYALPLERLVACRGLKGLVPVPMSGKETVGVFRFQGVFVPVFSLSTLLGLTGWRLDPNVLVVVALKGGELAAFDCESVPRIRPASQAQISGGRAPREGAVTILLFPGEEPLNLLDPDALFRGGGRAA